MAATPQKFTGIVKVDLDSDETRVPPGAATYVNGWTWEVNKNGSDEGYNSGVATPREGAILQSGTVTLPVGVNICVGTYESKESNEAYFWVWNSNQNHLIYRVRGVDGSAGIVYKGKHLRLRSEPKYYISGMGRATLKIQKFFNKATGKQEDRKFLIWTDHTNQPRFLSVEDSVQTSSFTDPYFTPFATVPADVDAQVEKYINLAVETPMQCVTFEPQLRLPNEATKQNLMLYKGWQWRIKYIDVWGRESEHGVISDRYFTLIGSTCLASSNSLPRCVRLTIPAGSPLVNKIQIEFRNCATNSDLTQDTDWYLYDTLDKYDNSGNVQFWLRSILNPYQVVMDDLADDGLTSDEIAERTAHLTEYNDATNTFGYTFCGDKQCSLIPVSETQRTDNLVPRTSSGIFPLNEGVAAANNLRGFESVSPEQIAKIRVEAEPPVEECANQDLRRITVYALIYRPNDTGDTLQYGKIKYYDPPGVDMELDLDACGGSKKHKHRVTWGITNGVSPGQHKFTSGQDNFVMYLAGTPHLAIGKQVLIDPSNIDNECASGIYMFDDITVENDDCQDAADAFWVPFQKFEFLVPPGRYVARLAHHMCYTNEDYQSSSTFTTGKRTFADFLTGNTFFGPSTNTKEMDIDVSSGDYIAKGVSSMFFMIQAMKNGLRDLGYVIEDVIDRHPISLAKLTQNGGGQPGVVGAAAIQRWTSVTTDHNGFFFASNGMNAGVYVLVDRCDEGSTPGIDYYTPNMPGTLDSWGGLGCRDSISGEALTEYFLYAGTNRMPAENRRVIRGRINLCDSALGVSGVSLVPFNLQPVRTDSKGEWLVVAHGRRFLPAEYYQDNLVITQAGCSVNRCDNPCDASFDLLHTDYVDCDEDYRQIDLGIVYVGIGGVNQSGPQNGGRYQFGVVFHDGNGRHGAVQTADHLLVDIPSMIDTRRFVHSKLNFTISGSFIAPVWAEYMSFCITRNLAWSDFFMWSADRIAFADAAGTEGVSNPTKIRIYYESMVEYQKQNGFGNTNTVWQFISTGDNESTQILGDVIEFYRNGTGTWFNELVQYNVRYNNAGKYIEIDYVPDLKDLKEGVLFKVIRPKNCVNTEPYMELCPTIKIIDGNPQLLTGELGYRDSYILGRTFPVPIYTEDADDPTVIIKTVSVRYSSYYYEHHSPSDFWGDHCSTRGRIFYKNPFERQQYLDTEIALSSPILNRSNFNGLSYFQESGRYRFDEQAWGSITVCIPEIDTILVLFKRNNFIVGFNDTGIRADANGNIYAGSRPGTFGTPQSKIGQDFGCQESDISTICKRNGVVVFIDRAKVALVFHGYTQAIDVSTSGFKGWLTRKIASQNIANQNQLSNVYFTFVAGVDPKYNEYYLTDTYVQLPDEAEGIVTSPDSKFVNAATAVDPSISETIVVDLNTGVLKGLAPFTPEGYATLEGFHSDRNVMMLRRGQAWSLHGGNPATPLLNYFGVQFGKTIQLVCNISPSKIKRFMYMEVYNSNHVLVATKVVTDQVQMSRLLAAQWERIDRFYAAAFLCDMNTPDDPNIASATGANAIQDGTPLYGEWAKITLQDRAADSTKYTELSTIVIYAIPSGQSAD